MTNYINNGENYFDPEKPSEEDKIKPKPPADEYGRKNHPRDRRLREFETMLARMLRFIQEFFGFEIFK